MEEIENAQERLENIRGVKPILSGLRTISLGSWQAALKRRSAVRDYAGRLRAMLPSLLPHLRTRRTIAARLRERLSPYTPFLANRVIRGDRALGVARVEALVIGSERGLCGRFNVAVADEAERYLRSQSARGIDVRLGTLGSRAQRVLQRRGYETTQAGALSVTALPSFSLAFELARGWLAAYERRELDAVDLIHNGYRGTGTYEPTTARLIPPRIPTGNTSSARTDEFTRFPSQASAQPDRPSRIHSLTAREQSRGPWPAPIVETDPLSLYATVVEQWAAVQLYEVLLDSAAAEHSTRFQLMESATQNADRLIDELTLAIQTARRQQITQEMGELAAGAGLIGRE
ncbi:MAG: FoF1 ATP synthase subunit gamma [Anaerolineae bacterium]|jgi:F-type H+-transporting ATPase subunit gamma